MHISQKWEKQSETALINEMQHKLTQITFALLLLSSWKAKSQVIRLASTFVASLPSDCKPLRQMVLHCSATCHGCEESHSQHSSQNLPCCSQPPPAASSTPLQSSLLLSTPSLPGVISSEIHLFIK